MGALKPYGTMLLQLACSVAQEGDVFKDYRAAHLEHEQRLCTSAQLGAIFAGLPGTHLVQEQRGPAGTAAGHPGTLNSVSWNPTTSFLKPCQECLPKNLWCCSGSAYIAGLPGAHLAQGQRGPAGAAGGPLWDGEQRKLEPHQPPHACVGLG